MDSRLRDEIAGIDWFHTIDLGDGVVTPGVHNTPERLPVIQMPDDLTGMSVLDIGAWDGFFSFEAERRGASRVLAVDSYSWHGDGWGTKNGFDCARRALNSRVEDLEVEVLDLSPETVGSFDLVLFLSVLYHMKHPLLALERVASVCRHQLILWTQLDLMQIAQPAVAFYPGSELNDDPTNWCAPNPPAVEGMLRTVGFTHVEMLSSWADETGASPSGRGNAVFHARRDEPTAESPGTATP